MSSPTDIQLDLDRKMASSVVRKLIDQKIIRTAAEPQNLYQLLSLLPRDGLGARVAPVSWVTGRRDLTREQQQRPSAVECENYYTITHVHLTPGYTQGVVSGQKTWQGKMHDKLPQPIDQLLASDQPWLVVKS